MSSFVACWAMAKFALNTLSVMLSYVVRVSDSKKNISLIGIKSFLQFFFRALHNTGVQ